MKLEGDYEFEASVQDVWDALFDPAVLAAAMPGCDKLELVDGAYLGELKVKVGPVQGKFSGKVDLLDQVPPKSYRMVVDGRGPQGFVKANATIELEEVADSGGGKTKLRYVSDAQIGGKIATVGQRLVEASAKAIVKQSLEGLNENVKIRAAAYREARLEVAAQATPAKPDDAATAKPDDTATAKPDDTATAKPDDAATARPDDVATARPDDAATARPDDEATAEPAAKVEAPAKKPDAPAIEYKRADASKMASAVAKEVGKTMAMPLIGIAIAAALLIYLIFIR